MPAPTITPLPDEPLRSDAPATFVSKAEAWVAAFPGLTDEINAFGAYLNDYSPGGAYTPGGTDVAVADGGTGSSTAAGARTNLEVNPVPVFNFSDDGEARFYADVAMTLTQQSTSGTGSVAYEKSTAAAPGTFSGTSSPVTLEAGAWLKVTASSVSGIYAVAIKRTA